jgi:Zn finger protein HypA/HybF involved in hydrogenase expression
MYGLDSSVNLIVVIIGVTMIIVFFMMSSRLKKISDILEAYAEIEFKKPEYKKTVKCEKCNKEFNVNIIQKGTVNCPECKNITRI